MVTNERSDESLPSSLYGALAKWLFGQEFNNVMLVANFGALLLVLHWGAQIAQQTAHDIEARHTEQLKQIVELCCPRRDGLTLRR